MAIDHRDEATDDGRIAALVQPLAPRPGREVVTAGFVALVDCAPLIVARDKGFAERQGLELTLVRETSWANIRDRIFLGHFDAAQMLAPMTIAATLGLGLPAAPVLAPLVLDLNGNAITVTTAVKDAMRRTGDAGDLDRPGAAGAALKRIVAARREAGEMPLTFGMTYPFSSHNYELRYWLASAGIDPDRDVRLTVVPPPMMAATMSAGHVDGYCVGAPWPTVAVAAGIGHVVATSVALKPGSMEKVLGVRKAWADRHPERLDALIRAVTAACAWCDDPANRPELAAMLARPGILDVSADLILAALSGRILTDPGAAPVPVANYLRFSGRNRPSVAGARWYAAEMVRWGQTANLDAALAAAGITFRGDLYDRALGLAGPASADRAVTLFDGVTFDANDPAAYLARLANDA
ncbi:MAG: CmpA/NrtA family ABC transporter substrate-binding protein [Ancalomicrobiaceae bacterium]|nr:CmpA/NrtA family ABC transporter substrate-binding protein [Ancalomicrobiaceae bacterium]